MMMSWRDGASPTSETRYLWAVALLSAAGSLPLHLAPVLVGALTGGEGNWTHAQANLVVSLIMSGMIAASLVAAMLRPVQIRPRHWLLTLTLYVCGTLVAGRGQGSPLIWPAWFMVGAACGTLVHFGVVVAANAHNAAAGFAWRISVAMLLAGLVMAYVARSDTPPRYLDVTQVLAVTVLVLSVLGMALLPAPAPAGEKQPPAGKPKPADTTGPALPAPENAPSQLFSLVMLFLFFALLVGFLNNAPALAAMNGVDFSTFLMSLAGAKMLIAVGIATVFTRPRSNRAFTTIVLGLLTSIAIVLIVNGSHGPVLFLALVAFECGLNIMSPRFSAALSASLETFGRNRLSIAILSGVVAGPVLFGWLVDSDAITMLMLMAMVGAFVPLIWQSVAGMTGRTPPRNNAKARAARSTAPLRKSDWRATARACPVR